MILLIGKNESRKRKEQNSVNAGISRKDLWGRWSEEQKMNLYL